MELADMVLHARKVMVFTGAGISTGSGIPDFRGPQGVWKRRKPVYFDEFLSSEEKRIEHWDFKLEGWNEFLHAEPNPGHLALVELERLKRLDTLVTQNIDGMHQKAGNSIDRIIELHGTNLKVECLTCGALTDPQPAMDFFAAHRTCPRCPCGGLQKTATISFGQAMPPGLVARAVAAAQHTDLVIAVGSSLTVHPAASVPIAAKTAGARYIIINQGETPQDRLADLRLSGDISIILPEAVQKLRQKLGQH